MASEKTSQSSDLEESTRRRRYRDLLNDGLDTNARVVTDDLISTLGRVVLIVEETNKLCAVDRRENASEILLDSQIMKLSHELVGRTISEKGGTEFSDTEYAEALNNMLHSAGPMNWDILADECAKIIKQSNFNVNVVGSFEFKPPKNVRTQTQRQKHQRRELAEEKRPEKLNKIEGDTKGMQKINIVMSQINAEYTKRNMQPIPYYRVVIDPDDFMHSVDNIFQIAFLVNSGLIAIVEGEDGLPAIAPITKEERLAFEQRNVKEHQICKITPKLCNEMIEKYTIRKPFLIFDRSDNVTPSQA